MVVMFLLLTLTAQKEALNSVGVPWSVTNTHCNNSISTLAAKTVEDQNTPLITSIMQLRYFDILASKSIFETTVNALKVHIIHLQLLH